MPNIFRMIVIFATTLVLIGEFPRVTLPQHRSEKSIRDGLEQNTNNTKYRTPFIIPISNPYFGSVTGPRPKSTESSNSIVPLPIERVRKAAYLGLDSYPLTIPPTKPTFDLASHQLHTPYVPIGASSLVVTTDHPTERRSKVVSVVRPNLEAIRERVALHNLTVSAIHDQLEEQQAWSIQDLQSLATQLLSVHRGGQLRRLYVALLTDREKQRIGVERGLLQCVDKFKQRLFETRVALEVNQFAVTMLEPQEAIQALDRIEEILDQVLTEEKTSATTKR